MFEPHCTVCGQVQSQRMCYLLRRNRLYNLHACRTCVLTMPSHSYSNVVFSHIQRTTLCVCVCVNDVKCSLFVNCCCCCIRPHNSMCVVVHIQINFATAKIIQTFKVVSRRYCCVFFFGSNSRYFNFHRMTIKFKNDSIIIFSVSPWAWTLYLGYFWTEFIVHTTGSL